MVVSGFVSNAVIVVLVFFCKWHTANCYDDDVDDKGTGTGGQGVK